MSPFKIKAVMPEGASEAVIETMYQDKKSRMYEAAGKVFPDSASVTIKFNPEEVNLQYWLIWNDDKYVLLGIDPTEGLDRLVWADDSEDVCDRVAKAMEGLKEEASFYLSLSGRN